MKLIYKQKEDPAWERLTHQWFLSTDNFVIDLQKFKINDPYRFPNLQLDDLKVTKRITEVKLWLTKLDGKIFLVPETHYRFDTFRNKILLQTTAYNNTEMFVEISGYC